MPDAELCNGSTMDFESICPGSNPGSAANLKLSRSRFIGLFLQFFNLRPDFIYILGHPYQSVTEIRVGI